ncbi:oxidoreductase/transition metal ion-binding protein, putative [Medicago truncatula]|uniref:Oxidoreductase/transition metal ion-binding protein, putative n=1 Tax=Medicago truncatula TaxID=3880 RepID=G8A2P3_MEDTR|nr:oxidoreductase/transition metal ion-binding protein, putative [Medicago truncatula]
MLVNYLLPIIIQLIDLTFCFFDSFVGIKQVVFGGEEFENWKEDLTSEDSGYGVHKI